MPLSKELQGYIDNHVQWTPGDHIERLKFLAFALVGEAGEMTGPIKKHWRGDKAATYDWMIEKLKGELPDIGNYLYMICKELGLDLDELMLAKFKVVEERPEWKDAHTLKLYEDGKYLRTVDSIHHAREIIDNSSSAHNYCVEDAKGNVVYSTPPTTRRIP